MSKVLKIEPHSNSEHAFGDADYVFFCPGCKCGHGVWTRDRGPKASRWSFNGDLDRPTFSPSILVRHSYTSPTDCVVCHSFIKNGRIQFLSDCTHELAGQTVNLEEM